jgi:hypothetical protein
MNARRNSVLLRVRVRDIREHGDVTINMVTDFMNQTAIWITDTVGGHVDYIFSAMPVAIGSHSLLTFRANVCRLEPCSTHDDA